DRTVLLFWCAAQFVVLTGRWLNHFHYRTKKYQRNTKEWKKRFLAGIIFSAFIWGMVPILFFPENLPLHQSFLIIIIAGMTAGSVSSLASIRYGSYIFLTIVLFPLIVILMMQQGSIYSILAFTVFLYWILLCIVAKHAHENVTEALQMRILHEKALSDLELSEEKFEMIFKEAPVGIYYYNKDLIVIDTNNEMLQILGIERNQMIGLDLKKLPDQQTRKAIDAALNGEKGYYEGSYESMIRKYHLWITVRTSPLYDIMRNIIGGVAIVTDITNQVIAQKKIEHHAFYDVLTDLPNRILLKDRLEQAFVHFQRYGDIVAVIFLDLDNFKNINDSFGHQIGDELLIEVSKRLQRICRKTDTASRLGGDEFVVLLTDLGEKPRAAAKKAETVADKIHKILSLPLELDTKEAIIINSSIGVALSSDKIHNADALLKMADMAMYQAKREGKHTTRFYLE
ncbi:MAG: hypothetical protein DRP58_10635, partial [Spirochaetes bacterium]